jgi:hypothetical protein
MVAIFLLVLGAAGLVAGITMLSASGKARSWPVVTGRIVERSVGPSTTSGASRPGRYFEPKVTYSYTVEGKPYSGHRITLTTNAYDEAAAQRAANALPDSVEVHYNPSDPGDAVLQTSAIGMAIVALIFGVLCLLSGGGILFSSFTK